MIVLLALLGWIVLMVWVDWNYGTRGTVMLAAAWAVLALLVTVCRGV